MNNIRIVPLAQPANDGGGISGAMAPLAAVEFTSGVNRLALLSVNIQVLGAGGLLPLSGGDDATDSVAVDTGDNKLFSISRMTVYDAASNTWMRAVSAPTDADGVVYDTVGRVLQTFALQALNNGASLSRQQSASAANVAAQSGEGAALTTGPGEWQINQAPAAATQATATRAAGGAGVRNVLRSITVSVGCVALQAPLGVVVRDGASGAGTIIWRALLGGVAGEVDTITLTGLNIVGSDNTAMTVETLAAPAATNFATVHASGYSASA